ncbi:UDP-3-O-(3-hydroxymyristoyl)glucosamine N-acyltransferase [Bacteriovorax sp. Seq25_V]|uniref:UDP-3-O-(3-hydroxymyristoyl)glucosamine N-acyltransferase n=1 Tax=Bacteriovorax sp. Seq25_V TaxID=1201288 RepID=UPI000389DD69|nr:UDP-3-O-(3-hydroxymyristoyl)glucosamine N-acyltransferase [Bacteriovorax sp. Seq25_V]EQC47397.1 UDP-3-O-[3-hydroxymyristoyl] glucosamine N-acyltransferase [Bacteriovorax sp. Seq25_V]
MKISEILKIDDGLELVNADVDIDIETISTVDSIVENSVSFIGNKKFYNKLVGSSILPKVIIFDIKYFEEIKAEALSKLCQCQILTSRNLPVSISRISKPFYDKKIKTLNYQVDGRKLGTASVHPSARVAENVFIGENVVIGEDVVIMPSVTILPNVEISSGTVVYPNVTIYPNSKIGENCRIHAGTVIGSDGFGYNFDKGEHLKIWHFGGVIIENNVELGSNVSIDQGTFSPTIIRSGTKLDNLVHIAHNVQIGSGAILCGQVGIAGSAKIGNYTVFGGKAAVSDGVTLGNGVKIAGACVVASSFEEDGIALGGHPARPLNEWLRGLAFIRKNSVKK